MPLSWRELRPMREPPRRTISGRAPALWAATMTSHPRRTRSDDCQPYPPDGAPRTSTPSNPKTSKPRTPPAPRLGRRSDMRPDRGARKLRSNRHRPRRRCGRGDQVASTNHPGAAHRDPNRRKRPTHHPQRRPRPTPRGMANTSPRLTAQPTRPPSTLGQRRPSRRHLHRPRPHTQPNQTTSPHSVGNTPRHLANRHSPHATSDTQPERPSRFCPNRHVAR